MGDGTVGGEDVRDVVREHLPGYPVETVAALGEGEDNTAYEVNGELIVRFAKDGDPRRRAAKVRREAALLGFVAGISPLPVPEPRFVAAERGCLAYAKLPGVPLIDVAGPPAAVAETLGGLLRALHDVPASRATRFAEVDDEPTEAWRREAAATYAQLAGEVPGRYRPAVERFLAAPPPEGGTDPVFTHNDLGIEHVLADGARVTGVIDWSDAAITDPAVDFGRLYRDLGPGALDAALRRYGDREPAERAVFYARCAVLEDMAYGIETGDEKYLRKSLRALDWLFP
ncbi:phosphotransferase family protein [Actinomadura keratinilytica]|jgi:aminoglycoside phosphotransferase (APT) family kinase protein|uniref:Aminoglycoside phosphotransferase domain-containing protein n=1 Tax=Actinomadura keratinilytica TaxID=547461 RepID=A0ABP7YEP3_9ACTN